MATLRFDTYDIQQNWGRWDSSVYSFLVIELAVDKFTTSFFHLGLFIIWDKP